MYHVNYFLYHLCCHGDRKQTWMVMSKIVSNILLQYDKVEMVSKLTTTKLIPKLEFLPISFYKTRDIKISNALRRVLLFLQTHYFLLEEKGKCKIF